MFNFEGRQNLDWLAALRCPLASRVIMLLVFAALLALAAPAAHAAGCTAYDTLTDDSEPFYVMVPASNFIKGPHKIYVDKKCEISPTWEGGEQRKLGLSVMARSFSPGSAFAKNARKAMKICELNIHEPVAAVQRVDFYTHYRCIPGKHNGPERQRRMELFSIDFNGDAKGALKRCRKWTRGEPKDMRANHVEPGWAFNWNASGVWTCYRVWNVSKSYLEQVGA